MHKLEVDVVTDSPSTEKPERDSSIVRKDLPRLTYVVESQYVGDRALGGAHAAKLTTVPSSTKTKHQPLFRWLHCTRQFMDFDDFSVTRIPDFTNAEQKDIRDLLSKVRLKCVKTVQTSMGKTVRHMEPACIQQILQSDGTTKTQTFARRTVTWVCLPYFSLEKYSGLLSAAENPSAFPIETLLQAKLSRALRERDMRQAVCQDGNTPPGLCFHIAQIWCLVVDNSFLLTYSRMTEEALRGETINVTTISQELSATKPQGNIAVSYNGNVVWSIPLENCHSWLDFLSHFRDFWPGRMLFFHHKRPVTVEDWPRIWNTARHVSEIIMLELRIGASPELPPAGVLKALWNSKPAHSENTTGQNTPSPERPPDSPRMKGKSTQTEPNMAPGSSRLSIFSCLAGVTGASIDAINTKALTEHLQEVEDYLTTSTSFSDRRAYRDCPEATRAEIYALLEKKGALLSGQANPEPAEQKEYETQLGFFNAAELMFNFFFPVGAEVPTGETTERHRHARRDYTSNIPLGRNIRSYLKPLCVRVLTFNDIFAHVQKADQSKITVPKELIEGWIHFLMGFIYMPTDPIKTDRLIDDAKTLINAGMAVMIYALSDKSLLDCSVLMPLELLSLTSLRLLRDATVGMPDITSCYSSSLGIIEAGIVSKPSDRSLEYRIGLLVEEISVIQRTLEMQFSVFESLMAYAQNATQDSTRLDIQQQVTMTRERSHPRQHSAHHHYHPPPVYQSPIYSNDRGGDSYRDRDYIDGGNPTYVEGDISSSSLDYFKVAPTDPGGYRVLLVDECLQFLSGRVRDFQGFRSQAFQLEKVNRNKIDTTKDRHDNAVYAFTIVTVIFLPLSAVASIFGMNTRDVRDMELDQWAYWAAAVPVTAVVIFLGLLWTGELATVGRWIQSFGGGGGANTTTRGGYQVIPSEIGLGYDEAGYVRAAGPPLPLPPPPPVVTRVITSGELRRRSRLSAASGAYR
ncbi:hypothetical protein B0H63DRAFT_394118 [Podospora didyma]|uniref:Uncharacterized protein n=1 Tax=Podospora didyma TaxID=330526 RepID=A0AAE0NQF9_9PEZI|nr:hypothetical protein B0H63DRAFT_394118 [Podospora didyma]